MDDTYEPAWGDIVSLDPGSHTEYTLYFYGQDLALDDDVQGLSLDAYDLGWAAGQGEITVASFGNLFELTVEVEPVW